MTDMKTKAQKIWDTYREGYAEALCTPVENFDTYLDNDSRKIVADVIREVVNQLQYQSFHHTEDHYQLDADDILKLCNELETL
jgi:hypothetical protein